MSRLIVERIGPGASVQDMGRTGFLAQGLSRGGAADRLALLEGAALMGHESPRAALELTGPGGRFRVTQATRIALTGAPMPARLGDRALAWNAVHALAPGDTLELRAAPRGVWSYLHAAGGIDTPEQLGSRGAHLSLGLGTRVEAGTELPLAPDDRTAVNRVLPLDTRFEGGRLRLLPSAHTALFAASDLERLEATTFTRDPRGNRQGVRLAYDGAPFATEGQLALPSEIITPGDIQMTGEGAPYILLPECQTVGGYPRIASVLPADLPRAAQAAPGATLRLAFVDRDSALTAHLSDARQLAGLAARVTPLTRDPRDIPDLLSYQLISGVTSGRPDPGASE